MYVCPQEHPDIQRRLAVLGCQLRKTEVSKKTYEVATDKLLHFTEVSPLNSPTTQTLRLFIFTFTIH